jgi:hypothetical protein
MGMGGTSVGAKARTVPGKEIKPEETDTVKFSRDK